MKITGGIKTNGFPRVTWSIAAAEFTGDPKTLEPFDVEVTLPNSQSVTVTNVRFEQREVRGDEQGAYVVYHWSGEYRPEWRR